MSRWTYESVVLVSVIRADSAASRDMLGDLDCVPSLVIYFTLLEWFVISMFNSLSTIEVSRSSFLRFLFGKLLFGPHLIRLSEFRLGR